MRTTCVVIYLLYPLTARLDVSWLAEDTAWKFITLTCGTGRHTPEQEYMMSSPAKRQRLATREDNGEARTPGRDGECTSRSGVEIYGDNCYRCGQDGHWARNCPLNSRSFKTQWRGTCDLCKGPVKLGESGTFSDDNKLVHVRCQLGACEVELRMQDRLAGASQQSSAAAAEDDPFDEIDRCVDEDDDNIGVNSAAGSGKTHLICKLAERQRLLGKRVLALTLNRDAAQELRSRGFKEAQTFHSLAACALRQQGRDATLLQTEEDESDKEDAASEADELPAQEAPKEASALPSKTKLILRELFPDEDGPTGPRQCLEVALFEPFVSHMVSLGKMCAFGIDPMIGGIDNNMDEWLALEKRYEAADLIEGVLRPDNWEKSKLTAHRWKEANQKWPTKSVRVKKGLRMASEAFLASLRCADHSSWVVERGQPALRKLSFRNKRGKKTVYKLPLRDYDDILYLVVRDQLDLLPRQNESRDLEFLCASKPALKHVRPTLGPM